MKTILFSLIASVITAIASLSAAPQAVVFDWGNVIGFDNRAVIVNFMCNSLHLSKSEFESANLEKRKAVQEGVSEINFWLKFAEKKGIHLPKDWEHQYTAALKESVGADPNMYVLIDQLKKVGMRVGMLSNIDHRYAKLIRDFGFYGPFEPCLLSYEMELRKPDPKAYELLIKTMNLPAGDIVFIDDKVENVAAAKTIGIDAIVFESLEQLKDELLKRDLLKD